jgi:hypothetical protein
MLVEGKVVQTGLEIIAKKLVDIFGDRMKTKLFNKNKTRTASREAYEALREIEQAFAEIQSILDDELWLQGSSDDWLSAGVLGIFHPVARNAKSELIDRFREQLGLLSLYLKRLKIAFDIMKIDMEIYESIDRAATVDLYILADTNVLKALFNYKIDAAKFDMKSLIPPMREASALARATISTFIARNFTIESKS